MVNLITGEIGPDGTQALAVIGRQVLSILPSEAQVDEALRQAGHLATRMGALIEQQHLYQTIGKKKHVLADAWETIIFLDGATPWVDDVGRVEEDGVLVAYLAKVSIWKDGEAVANGWMECGLLDEFVTRGATGRGKHRSAQSAAQTWALAKAARMRYAWLIVMAGYSPTPAEEMDPRADGGHEAPTATRQGAPVKPAPAILITRAQGKEIDRLRRELTWTGPETHAWIVERYQKELQQLTAFHATEVIETLTAQVKDIARAQRTAAEPPAPASDDTPATLPDVPMPAAEGAPGDGQVPVSFSALYRLAFGAYGMTKYDVWQALGVTDDAQIVDLGEAWRRIQDLGTSL